jgi:RND family efflux transporter MFP subunit
MSTFLQQFFTRQGLRQASRLGTAVVVTVVLLLAVAWGYSRYALPSVVLTEVVEGPVVEAFYATGTLVPYREYPVKSNVDGTLIEVLVDKGAKVKKGDVLARVYVEEFVLRRQQAAADLELKMAQADEATSPTLLEFDVRIQSTDAQLEVARREYDRLARLRNSGGSTLSEFDRAGELVKTLTHAREALVSSKATKQLELQRDVKFARAALELAEWNVSQQAIMCPIDGVVLDWPLTRGTRVRENDLLLHVGNVAPEALVLRANVDEEDVTRIRPLQVVKVSLYAYPQRVFEGRVQHVYPKADPTRRTFEVDIEVLQPEASFAAGMTSEIAFVVAEKERARVVPSQAVQRGQLWVVRDGCLQPLEVKLGLRSILRTEVLSGVELGEQVMVSALGSMTPGTEVRTTYVSPAVAAGLNEPKKDETKFSKF